MRGRSGGGRARRLASRDASFLGLGLGGIYTFAMRRRWECGREQPENQPKWLPGASFRANITSEYLGVGYIIGPRVSGTLFAGGVIFVARDHARN